MFDRNSFAKKLKAISDTYNSITDFGNRAAFDRSYISKYLNLKLSSPPSPNIIKKIADASNGITSYMELMKICGYVDLDESILKENLERELFAYNLTEEELNDALACFMTGVEKFQSLLFTLKFMPTIENETIKKERQVLDIIADYAYQFIPNDISLEHSRDMLKNEKSRQKFYYELEKAYQNSKKFLLSIDKNKIVNNPNNISPNKYVLDLYNSLSSNNQLEAVRYMRYLKSSNNTVESKIQILGQTAAGIPLEYGDSYAQDVDDISNIPNGADYALTVNGDSMEPLIKNGQLIYIKSTPDVENGTIAVVEIDGAVTCKKVYKWADHIELVSINTAYESIIITQGNFKILGKVII